MTESQHQVMVVKWSQQTSVREKYPELKYLSHVPNEERSVKNVAIAKAMGVKRGFPDLILPVPRGGYGCLLIELKTEKGRPSDAQKWWIEHMNAEGNFAEVCHGWQSAVRTLEWYLTLEKPERLRNG